MSHAVVQLGRIGDIINMLPFAWWLDQGGHRPAWIVQECYMDLFDGISYVDAEPWTGDIVDVGGAAGHMARMHSPIYVTQTYGNRGFHRQSDSFSKESWRLAGVEREWGRWPCVFDRRDDQREAELVRRHVRTDRPLILLFLEGHSSPMSDWNLLRDAVVERWGAECEILEAGPIRAHRFYDMLGLMERAAVMVAIDSAPLHLGAAARCPTVGLVADTPTLWHGTADKPHWLARVPYKQWPAKMNAIHNAIELAVSSQRGRPWANNHGQAGSNASDGRPAESVAKE